MIVLQVLNKIIESKEFNIVTENNLTEEHFIGYENEFKFILEHFNNYKKVPNKETFLSVFNEFDLITVTEPDKYLIDALNEEYLYYQSAKALQKTADILKVNSIDALEYLQGEVKNLQGITKLGGVDIIKESDERFKNYEKRVAGEKSFFITTGFEELDDIIHGWSKGQELVIFFARIGQGKSWVLVRCLTHAWEIGLNVGLISPEMSAEKIGYRFDTLKNNFSNSNLVWGKEEEGYKDYIEDLKKKDNCFKIGTSKDFNKKITVSKIRQFCISNNLDILGIDGLAYLHDERHQKGDNKTTALTNISEDLFLLSEELQIPMLTVLQSNRGGVKEDEKGTPEIENIRDSDGPAMNATKIIALRQTGAGIEFGIKKHRDGVTGGKLIYYWDINTGVFNYIPSEDDTIDRDKKVARVKEIKKSFKDGTDVF
jgi:replicative DNA helicase